MPKKNIKVEISVGQANVKSVSNDNRLFVAMRMKKHQQRLQKADNELRRGYPQKNFNEQSKGEEFRQAAKVITDNLAELTLKLVDHKRVVVVLPWRSALAFADSYLNAGISNFYHISSRRDEQTLLTAVDFESGRVNAKTIAIISDPMLATGNTIVDVISRLIKKGVKEENIIVNSIVAAPSGIANIWQAYSKIRIVVNSLDKRLDERGYIVPGLGDFGEKYFYDFSLVGIKALSKRLKLPYLAKKKLTKRIREQGIGETLNDLMERDQQDQRIAQENKKRLSAFGLKKIQSQRKLVIDTGRIVGVEKVVKLIRKQLGKSDRLIAISGESGTGKSTTLNLLTKKIKAVRFSLSEIFRYVAYCNLKSKNRPSEVLNRLSYKMIDGRLCLFDGKKNITVGLSRSLQTKAIDKMVPITSQLCQAEAISLAAKELAELAKQADRPIIIEGRAFTLDYLPADLRVELIADAVIRAERRYNQRENK